MKPAALKHITQPELAMLDRIRTICSSIAGEHLGIDKLSCHHMAYALSEYLGLRVVNGYFTKGFCHSWLLTDQGNIIDPYPPLLIGGPILVLATTDGSYMTPWNNCYLPDATIDKQLLTESFAKEVQLLVESIIEMFPEPSSR